MFAKTLYVTREDTDDDAAWYSASAELASQVEVEETEVAEYRLVRVKNYIRTVEES